MTSIRPTARVRSCGFVSLAGALALVAGGCQVQRAYDRQQGGEVVASSGAGSSATSGTAGAGKPATGAAQATASTGASTAAPSAGSTPAPRTLTAQERQVEDYAKLGYRLEWIGYGTVLSKQVVKSAAVLGDVLAVQDTSNALTLLNVRDGTARWTEMVDVPAANLTGLTRAGDAIIVSGESTVYLLNADNGALADKQRLARVANTAPAVMGEVLVFGTATGALIAHDVRSGMRPWAYMIDGPVQFPPVRIGESGVGAVSTTGQVLMLDARSGTITGSNQMFGGVASAPAADAETLYVASLDQSLYAYNARGGSIRWRVRTEEPLRGAPVVLGGRVYVQMPEGFTAIEAGSGKKAWSNADVRGALALVNPQGRGVVWDGSTATTLDMKTGQVVDRIALPSGSLLKPERLDGGVLFVVTPSGQVIKLAPRK